MKVVPLVSSLIAAAYAAPAPAEAIGEVHAWAADTALAEPNPLNSAPNGQKVLLRFSQQKPLNGGTRSTVKYGSYMVSSARMMSTVKPAKGPCTGCIVSAMEATIRYPGGAEANVDTGSWLHHIALFGSGAGGGSIWAAGNERPTLRLDDGGVNKYGIEFPMTFMLMIDLMVEDTKAKNLTLEISYEHHQKTSGYKAAKMYWLTIGEPAAKQGVYSFSTMPQTSTTSGQLLYAIGHMHDGGTDMTLTIGGKQVCKSVMHYGAREGYGGKGAAKMDSSSMQGGTSMAKGSKSASGGHSHKMVKRQHSHGGGGGADHISDPGACTNFGSISRGSSMRAVANYDATKHKLMTENGKPGKLMGNMRVYIGPS